MMRCSARRPRCTKNGDRNDLMVVALYHSVLQKYAEMREGSGMRELTEKQRAVPRLPLYDGLSARTQNSAKYTRRIFYRITRKMLVACKCDFYRQCDFPDKNRDVRKGMHAEST